ncbi:MAG: hypothetical protein HY868_18945 [Chloroflexi bacterium]|nr:hypothetical protein [Chloroflexota bacterium]
MSEQKPGWLARLRERFTRTSGDTIIANVGEGARDVVVGKNIRVVKIGTLVIPAVPVFVGVVAFIVLSALGAYAYLVPDKMPPGLFNIAVAEFGELGANQRVTVTANSQISSRLVFTTLRDELLPLGLGLQGPFKPVVWHDSMFPTQIRARIPLVAGNTPDARQDAAKTLATQLSAKMIVYGTLQTDQLPPSFIPEFYVAPLTGEADEIVGRYQFGSPIPMPLSSEKGSTWADSLALNKTFIARRQALAQIAFGFTFDLRGDHQDALTHFQEALRILQGTDNRAGEEAVYYFIGREYLFLANKKNAESPNAANEIEQFLAQAQAAFEQSRAKNESYARAHFGLGGVNRLRALRQPAAQRIEQPAFLTRAFEEYDLALKFAAQANEEQTQIKLRLALGTAHFLQAEAYLHKFDWAKAISAFDDAIQRTATELPNLKDQPRSLGEAYLTLGNAYYERGIAQQQTGDKTASAASFKQAIEQYGKCVDLKIFDPTLVQGAVVFCERYRADVQNALNKP